MKETIIKIKAGDKEAFASLYKIYYPKIYGFVYRILRDKHLAEDVTQEVFFRLWVNHQSLNEDMAYDSFLFTIAKNITMDIHRKNTLDSDYRHNQYTINTEPHVNETSSLMDFADLQKIIDETVNNMPYQQQRIFRLSRTEGLLNEEIAFQLGISKRTVEKHISNSLKTIKEIIKNNYLIFFM